MLYKNKKDQTHIIKFFNFFDQRKLFKANLQKTI